MFKEVIFPDVIKPGCVKNEGGKGSFCQNIVGPEREKVGESRSVREHEGLWGTTVRGRK